MRDPSDVLLMFLGGGSAAGTAIAVVGWMSLLYSLVRWGDLGRGWVRRRAAARSVPASAPTSASASASAPPVPARASALDAGERTTVIVAVLWLAASVFASAVVAATLLDAEDERYDTLDELLGTSIAQTYIVMCVAMLVGVYLLAWKLPNAALVLACVLGGIAALPFALIGALAGLVGGLYLAAWVINIAFSWSPDVAVDHGKYFATVGPTTAVVVILWLYVAAIPFLVSRIIDAVQSRRARR
ncbi:hypothetical protein OG216_45425 [Streptomycetaceae bacterium NBC_01309]